MSTIRPELPKKNRLKSSIGECPSAPAGTQHPVCLAIVPHTDNLRGPKHRAGQFEATGGSHGTLLVTREEWHGHHDYPIKVAYPIVAIAPLPEFP